MSSSVPTQAGEAPEVRLEWVVHPAAERPVAAAVAVLYLTLCVAALQYLFRSPFLTLLGGGLMIGAVADFLFPSRCRVTSVGVERGWRRIGWPEVRTAALADDRVILMGDGARWLAALRAVTLPCGARRDEVVALVDALAVQRRRPPEDVGGH